MKINSGAYGKPLIVLTETDPWLMVVGSDVPAFALYETGQIIYKLIENKELNIYEAILTEEGLQEVIQSFLIPDAIYTLPENIEASNWTDQPQNILTLNLTEKTKTINVYGQLKGNSEDRKKTPEDFLAIYDKIKQYKNKNAKEWLPEKIEVMFWGYDYAPGKRPWIKGFPDLNSPETVKFNDGSYTLFIDKANFDELKKYYWSMGDREAVEINGKKMSMSYRLAFPNIK